MHFEFTPGRRRHRRGTENPTFTVDRLWKRSGEASTEVTHLIDRRYGYHSDRELAWHLADRFGSEPKTVRIARL